MDWKKYINLELPIAMSCDDHYEQVSMEDLDELCT